DQFMAATQFAGIRIEQFEVLEMVCAHGSVSQFCCLHKLKCPMQICPRQRESGSRQCLRSEPLASARTGHDGYRRAVRWEIDRWGEFWKGCGCSISGATSRALI